jgi:hypothetical protein
LLGIRPVRRAAAVALGTAAAFGTASRVLAALDDGDEQADRGPRSTGVVSVARPAG